jgi:HTH-type transcriptional regulator/antitoxin HigA
MRTVNSTHRHPNFTDLMSGMTHVIAEFSQDFSKLMHYIQAPISSEEEALERAEVMDELMDMATGEQDIVMLFANAISDRIEEFESQQEMPELTPAQTLDFLMETHQTQPEDLATVAPKDVIYKVIHEQYTMTKEQIEGFARFFDVPNQMFSV